MSSATVRAEMAELEKRGYLIKPHTSAGRIPSEKAYNYFVEKFLEYHKSIKLQKLIEEIFKKSVYEEALKNLAKLLAQLSGQAVIVGFKFNHAYYTGLSNLFRHPEFQEYGKVMNLTATIDRMDDVLSLMFDNIKDEVRILIGQKNPFGSQTSLVITQYKYGDREPGVLALLGPRRMDYNNNYSLIRQAQESIKSV
jgi:heat-inducible transcriptional repressor